MAENEEDLIWDTIQDDTPLPNEPDEEADQSPEAEDVEDPEDPFDLDDLHPEVLNGN